MPSDMIFYTHPMSRGRTVRWMLEEVGQPYHTEFLEYETTMKAAPYLAINPMGKVPALLHGETVVTESAAICAYLADAFPSAALAPPSGSPGRGAYYRWLFFAAGPLEAAVTNQAFGFAVPPGRERSVSYGRLVDVLNVLETVVADTEYVAGARFSAADLYLGSQLASIMLFGLIEKRPAFESYCARLTARPAAVRAREMDDAVLLAQGDEKFFPA